MMDERRVAEYFVVAGLPDEGRCPLDGFSDDTVLKPTYKQDPIVDLTVINKGQGETAPARFRCIELTPTGLPADLNHGSIRFPEMYLCYRRGRDKPPITDIGVLYDGKEKISPGCEAVYQTPYGRPANVNNSNSNHIYVTYRRAMENASCDTLSVMDICIIIANKGETPPHAYMAVDKTLNKSMMGSTVYICYKKSMAKNDFLAYKPDILGRYPLEDHADFPLAHNVPMFCLPLGATIEAWPANAQHPMPKFSTFVLTQETGGKVYGAAVTFYEDYDSSTLSPQQQLTLGLITSPSRREPPTSHKTLHQSKCICLLSRWPFFSTFKTFLHYLYRISISGAHPVPLERYITHFLTEVPFPSPQRPRIQVELNFNTISLFLPEESPLPQSGASYTTLLKHLGPENCMNVLLFTLLEHKILIHSLCPAVLTSAAEAIAHMIFPFHWKCPYIPLCPLGLAEYLCAPTPFIVGVDSRYFDLFDPPPDVTCIDLDTNTVSVSEDKRSSSNSYKIMPKKLVKQLRSSLECLHEKCCLESFEGGPPLDSGFETYPVDQDLMRRKKRLQMDTAIQEAFLRFMVSLLRGYKNHLLPITQQPNMMTTDFTARFDVQGFIKSRDKNNQKFYQMLKDTQNFTSFIQERSFVSDKDASLEFFDECAEKMEEGREERLIEMEDACKSERTVVITPPEPLGDGQIFNYCGFPKLNPALYPDKPRPAQLTISKHAAPCPNSPMTKRTKQEIRVGQKAARKLASMPDFWAKCLLWHCYSLWFVHLPSHVKANHSKARALRAAYTVLCHMQDAKLHEPDEVCYRVLMQLCGQYHQPVLAVKVFSEMRKRGVNPNAITYGFYNKAVLESKWPSSNTAYLRWNKLRNALLVIAQFRQVLKARRRTSICSGSDLDGVSRASVDSYLDDGVAATAVPTTATKGVAALKLKVAAGTTASGDCVSDLVNVVEGQSEEKVSTGSMSDRGYSSMTLDDAKRISIVIGSQDSLDGKSRDGKVPNGHVKPLPDTKVVAKETTPDNSQAVSETSIDVSAPVGRIVRRSTDGGSGSMLDRDVDVSQSSLHMTAHETLDDSVFQKSLTPTPVLPPGGNSALQTSSRDASDNERTSLVDTSTDDSPSTTLEQQKDDSALLEDSLVSPLVDIEQDDSLPSSPTRSIASPVHSLRTPVTENDPLGLFVSPTLSAVASAPVIAHPMLNNLDGSLAASNESLEATRHVNRKLLIDLQPFGGVAASTPVRGAATEVPGVHYNVGPSGDADTISNPSPLEPWSPLPGAKSEEHTRKSSTLPANSNHSTPQHDRNRSSSSSGHHRGGSSTPTRSESFHTSFRSITSRMANKLTQWTTPTKGGGSGSSSSLHRPEIDRLITEEEEAAHMRKAGSLDHLGHGDAPTNPASSSTTQKQASLEDVANDRSVSQKAGYHNKLGMPGLFNKASHLWAMGGGFMPQSASKMTGWASKMTANLKTSLKESFSLGDEFSDSDDDEYYFRAADTQSISSSSITRDDDGSLHDYSDKASLITSILEPRDAPDTAQSGAYTTTRAPQHQNLALEVEMSSLSRCNTCHSLLYDEEIMAGWTPDDSNLNSECPFCAYKYVPSLQVYIKDYRHCSKPNVVSPSQSVESMHSVQSGTSLGQTKQGAAYSSAHCNGIHKSMTSLTSADNFTCADNKSVDSRELLMANESSSAQDDSGAGFMNDSSPNLGVKKSASRVSGQKCVQNGSETACDNNLIQLSPEATPAKKTQPNGDDCAVTDDLISIASSEKDALITLSVPDATSTDQTPASDAPQDSSDPAVTSERRGSGVNVDVSDSADDDSLGEQDVNTQRLCVPSEPITVPYLSPLVLRKELENVLEQDGDQCLSSADFVDGHPILYWNLLWYFTRLGVHSHILGFVLSAAATNKVKPPRCWSIADSRHVSVRLVWDNAHAHSDLGNPLYILWKKALRLPANSTENATDVFSVRLLSQMLQCIRDDDLLTPVQLIMAERQKLREQGATRFRSMYRDLLFLTLVAYSRDSVIDIDLFDREYRSALQSLSQKESNRLHMCDSPPSQKIATCRRVFSNLEL